MAWPENKYLTFSIVSHLVLLAAIVLSAYFATPLTVVENTNQHDVISAVVLGDTPKSRILPKKMEEAPLPKAVEKPAPSKTTIAKADAIPLKIIKQKKIADDTKKQRELLEKMLLSDIKKQSEKQKKVQQKKLADKFAKMLRDQAEESMRKQLLNDEIKLKGTVPRYSQGVVDKYKALILQAISEHWIVPPGANKRLTSELIIRVAPGGMVLDVQVTKSSGDPSLDSSARAAVLKASPLPVPQKSVDFAPFKQFVLKVKPENIRATSL